jgi:hypothetical protein
VAVFSTFFGSTALMEGPAIDSGASVLESVDAFALSPQLFLFDFEQHAGLSLAQQAFFVWLWFISAVCANPKLDMAIPAASKIDFLILLSI